jgi:hypothetical protein
LLQQQLPKLAVRYEDFPSFYFGQVEAIVLANPKASSEYVSKKNNNYGSWPP